MRQDRFKLTSAHDADLITISEAIAREITERGCIHNHDEFLDVVNGELHRPLPRIYH
jgi:hypothetical protein